MTLFLSFFAIMSTCFSKCCLSEFQQLIFLKGTQNFWRLATSESIFLASFLVCNGIKLCRFWIMYSKKKLFQTAVSARIISQNVEHLQSRNFVVFQKKWLPFWCKKLQLSDFSIPEFTYSGRRCFLMVFDEKSNYTLK